MEERLEGKVVWFSDERGYGFVNPLDENGDVVEDLEYFVHYSSIEAKGFKTLKEKQVITFELLETDRGMQAAKVRLEQ